MPADGLGKLAELLPDFVAILEGGLVQIGRGDVVDQLREARLARWTYDEFADAAYLVLAPAGAITPGTSHETLAPLDDVNVDLDADRRVLGIEVLGARELVQRLEDAPPE